MNTNEAVDKLTQRIVERFQPQRLILFGSRARGDARDDGDNKR